MTQIDPHESQCAKCALDLMQWKVFEGVQFRHLEHYLTPDMVRGVIGALPLGPYCWKCWGEICDIVRKGPK